MSKRIITNSKYRTITCRDTNCNCVFSFDNEDIITKEDNTKIVTCPVCKQENTPAEIPER